MITQVTTTTTTQYSYWHRSLKRPCRIIGAPLCNEPWAQVRIALQQPDGTEREMMELRGRLKMRRATP